MDLETQPRFVTLRRPPLYFDDSEEHHTIATSGDTIGALIDAMFQIGDSALGPGQLRPFTFTDNPCSEKTVKQEEGDVRKEGGCAWRCCAVEDADVTTDAQRALERL